MSQAQRERERQEAARQRLAEQRRVEEEARRRDADQATKLKLLYLSFFPVWHDERNDDIKRKKIMLMDRAGYLFVVKDFIFPSKAASLAQAQRAAKQREDEEDARRQALDRRKSISQVETIIHIYDWKNKWWSPLVPPVFDYVTTSINQMDE